MMLSDRYSCQEHGTDKHEDCIACEVYGDIAGLVDRIAELEDAIKYATEYGEVAFLGVNMPFKAFKRLKEVLNTSKELDNE